MARQWPGTLGLPQPLHLANASLPVFTAPALMRSAAPPPPLHLGSDAAMALLLENKRGTKFPWPLGKAAPFLLLEAAACCRARGCHSWQPELEGRGGQGQAAGPSQRTEGGRPRAPRARPSRLENAARRAAASQSAKDSLRPLLPQAEPRTWSFHGQVTRHWDGGQTAWGLVRERSQLQL